MKKIVLLSAIVTIFAFSASAQRAPETSKRGHDKALHGGRLTRGEKMKLHKNDREYARAKRMALRDGKLTAREKQKLAKMRKHDRKQTVRFKHNSRKRAI